MNLQRTLLVAAVLLTVSACDDDDVVTTPTTARAGIRYINAVPDTIALDFHAVDRVENSPYIATLFREVKIAGYAPAAAEPARHFKVFPNSPNIAVTSIVMADTTLALQANTSYSFLHVGFARPGQTPAKQLIIRVDTMPTVPAGQIAVRVVHVGAGAGNVDVYATATATTAPSGTPRFANVAFLGSTPYVNLPTAATLSFRLTAAGSTAPLGTVTLPVGDPGSPSLDPAPGSNIAGSVFTVYVFGRSAASTGAPQTAAFQTAGLSYASDVQLHTRPTT